MPSVLLAICFAFVFISIILSIRRKLIISQFFYQFNNPSSHYKNINMLQSLLSLDICLFVAFSITLIIISSFINLQLHLWGILLTLLILLLLKSGTSLIKNQTIQTFTEKAIIAITSVMFVILSHSYLTNLGGIFGITNLNIYESSFISTAIYLIIISSLIIISKNFYFFLTITIFICSSLGVIFFSSDKISLMLLSFILTATLLGFLRQDILYSNNKKNLTPVIAGLILTYLVISYLNAIHQSTINIYYSNPASILAILIIPLSELIKFAIVGYLNKLWSYSNPINASQIQQISIFQKFTTIELSRRRASRSIIIINLMLILFSIAFNSVSPFILASLIFTLAIVVNLLLDIKINRHSYNNINQKNVNFVEEINVTTTENQ